MTPLSILIIGAGKLGRETGQRLTDAGHKLTFVEKEHESAAKAKEIFGDHVFFGDGCDPKVLERAGVSNIQVIIAATGDDEDNLIIAELAHHIFNIPCVLTASTGRKISGSSPLTAASIPLFARWPPPPI